MCGAVWIDVGEFPQTVRPVVRWDQAAFEVFQRFPFGIEGVGVTDIEVHTRRRAEGIVLGPLGQVNRRRSAVGKTVPLRAFVAAGVEIRVDAGSGTAQVAVLVRRRPSGWPCAVHPLAVATRDDDGVPSAGLDRSDDETCAITEPSC